MYITHVIIVLIFFLFGGILNYVVHLKSEPKKRQYSWIKFWNYFLVVVTLFLIISSTNVFPFFAAIIVLRGAYELVILKIKISLKIKSLFFYSLFTSFFILFSLQLTTTVLFVFSVVMISDGFGQLFGQLYGKKKLFPTISPNKTIAGFIGGALSGIGSAFILGYGRLDYFLPLAILAIVGANIGDFLASKFKRMAEIKDFPLIIHGHGGFLDRFDSFLFAGSLTGITILLYGNCF